MTGSARVARALRARGVGVVFGVPGTQNVPLLDELRQAGIRVLSGTSELTTSFMANGAARFTRRPAVLTTIPGPGFTYALSGVAEARLDSVPLVWICLTPTAAPDDRRVLQAIPQAEMAAPLVKAVVPVEEPDQVEGALERAFHLAGSGEPGPVLVHVAGSVLGATAEESSEAGVRAAEGSVPGTGTSRTLPLRAPPPDQGALEAAVAKLLAARRPVLYVGQGGLDAPGRVQELAEALGAAVVTTTSARGVVAEDHPLVLAVDRPGAHPEVLNELLDRSDVVLALGCGFSHNGSHGFRLRIDPDRLIHVDASEAAFEGPYRARTALHCDVRTFLEAALGNGNGLEPAGGGRSEPANRDGEGWSAPELAKWRERLTPGGQAPATEPRVPGVADGSMAAVFRGLRSALGPDSVLTTDSGRHQMLARRYLQVLRPGGLIVPTNFQSMGFGIPAALGVRAAGFQGEVVALVGDGGLQITWAELLVGVREKLEIRVVVFTDGEFALIADHQRRDHGRATATRLRNPEMEALARTLGCRFLRLGTGGDPEPVFREMTARSGVTLVEVPLSRSAGSRVEQARALTRESVRSALGPQAASGLKRWARRWFGRGA